MRDRSSNDNLLGNNTNEHTSAGGGNGNGCDNELCRSVEANLSLHENDSNDFLLSGRTVEIVLHNHNNSARNSSNNNMLDVNHSDLHSPLYQHRPARRRRRQSHHHHQQSRRDQSPTTGPHSSSESSRSSTSSSSFFREAVYRTADNHYHLSMNHNNSGSNNLNYSDGMRSICSWIGMEHDDDDDDDGEGGIDHTDRHTNIGIADDFSELLSMEDPSLLTSSCGVAGGTLPRNENNNQDDENDDENENPMSPSSPLPLHSTLPNSTTTKTASVRPPVSTTTNTTTTTTNIVDATSSPMATTSCNHNNNTTNVMLHATTKHDEMQLEDDNNRNVRDEDNAVVNDENHGDNNDDDDDDSINAASTATTTAATIAERTEEYLQNAATGIVRDRPGGDPEYAHTVLEDADVLLGYTCHTKPLQIWREIRGSRRWISEAECHLLIVKYRETLAERYPSLQTPRQPLILKKATAAESAAARNNTNNNTSTDSADATYTWSRQLKNGEVTHWRKATFRDIQKDVKSKRHPRKDLSTAIAEFRQELSILKQLGIEMAICDNLRTILNGFQVIEDIAHVGAETNMTSKFCEVMRCLLDKVKKLQHDEHDLEGRNKNINVVKHTQGEGEENNNDDEDDDYDDEEEDQGYSGKKQPSSKRRAAKRGSRSSTNTCPRPLKQSKTGTKKKKANPSTTTRKKKVDAKVVHKTDLEGEHENVEITSSRKKASKKPVSSTRKEKTRGQEDTPPSAATKDIEEFYRSTPAPPARESRFVKSKHKSTSQTANNSDYLTNGHQVPFGDGMDYDVSMIPLHSNVTRDDVVSSSEQGQIPPYQLDSEQPQQNWIMTHQVAMLDSFQNRRQEFQPPFAISMQYSNRQQARVSRATTQNAEEDSLSSDDESIHDAFSSHATQRKNREFTNILESYIGSTILPQNDSNMSVSSCSGDELLLGGNQPINTNEFPNELAIAYCGLSRVERPPRSGRLASDTPELESIGRIQTPDAGQENT